MVDVCGNGCRIILASQKRSGPPRCDQHLKGPDLSTGISGQEADIILHDKSRRINRDFYFSGDAIER
jgi:hypothetical protein